jgi:hypothetical protein
MFLKAGVLFRKMMTRFGQSDIPLNALVFGKSRKVNLGHDIKSSLERMHDISGDSSMTSWKRSGDEVTDIRKDGIVTNIGSRGNRRLRTDGRIHSSSNRWFGR